jgi:vacuolar-type H+-ATPase subunit H
MQKVVLDEIIKAEKDAEKIVEDARTKAAEIVSIAEADYNRAIIEAKESAQKRVQDSAIAAKAKAEEDFAKAVKQTEEENTAFLEKSYAKTEEIANRITEMLLRPEYERE